MIMSTVRFTLCPCRGALMYEKCQQAGDDSESGQTHGLTIAWPRVITRPVMRQRGCRTLQNGHGSPGN